MSDDIVSIRAREILDARGWPTVEVDVILADGATGRAAVPSGASTGSREAAELRDADPRRFRGQGVIRAVANVNDVIAPALRGQAATEQAEADARLQALDGTPGKMRLGANAVLGVSLAVARAAAASRQVPLYEHLGGARLLPVPMFNILNGGAHADTTVDVEEFMVMPVAAPSFHEALRLGVECHAALQAVLKRAGYRTAVGDEGGCAPELRSSVEGVELTLAAIEHAGLRPAVDVALALDMAATTFRDGTRYLYGKSAVQMVDMYEDWVRQYPIQSIEDALAEDDWEGWRLLTERLGATIQLVGDDLCVTNAALVRQAVQRRVANAVLIKLNQVGTVTEAWAALDQARHGGYAAIVSHRSGETVDDFIADFAVATGAGQIKAGAPCRGEHVAKYNRLLRIEEELGTRARHEEWRPALGATRGDQRREVA
jgi:enolase